MTRSISLPIVSIGMPVYNGERYIKEVLDSLLVQDFKDFELIISDNASTDSTAEICQTYAANDSRIKYHRNETNLGSTANFNGLVKLACGKYFMWVSDDDLWEPSFVSSMVESLDSNPDAVLSFCRYDNLFEDKQPFEFADTWSKIVSRSKFQRLLYTCYLKPFLGRACYIYGLMRRDILLRIGGTEARIDAYRGADVVTLFHLLFYGKFITIDKILYHRRWNTSRNKYQKESLSQKLAGQSFFSFVESYFQWLSSWHQYYQILRVIVRENSIQLHHKIILLVVIYIAEFLYYLDNFLRALVRNLFEIGQFRN